MLKLSGLRKHVKSSNLVVKTINRIKWKQHQAKITLILETHRSHYQKEILWLLMTKTTRRLIVLNVTQVHSQRKIRMIVIVT